MPHFLHVVLIGQLTLLQEEHDHEPAGCAPGCTVPRMGLPWWLGTPMPFARGGLLEGGGAPPSTCSLDVPHFLHVVRFGQFTFSH
mmetsp:Transcript_40764/g.71699  ORF Transcript_40764/g.71699 Transcript_40764/m.71699 type:complete len:85 (-) Transcript_40764:526-780(-)